MSDATISGVKTWCREHRLLLCLLIVSVGLRVGVAFYMGDVVPPPVNAPDETSYSYLAARLAAGYGYSFDRPWYPFGHPAGTPTAHWSFLYTALLGGVYAVAGVHPLVARLLSAVLGGILLPWMVYRLARRVFPSQPRVALVALACAGFYGYFVLYAALLMTETLFIVALLWTLERALALAHEPKLSTAVLFGLGLGGTTLLRQSALPWIVVQFAWLLWVAWRSRRLSAMIRALFVSGVLLILAILPVTLRNIRVYDDFLLLNSNAGFAMYSAQHPMHGTHFQEYSAAPLPPEVAVLNLNEAQMDRELMQRGIAYVLDDPGRYLLLSLSRVADFFVFWPTADSSLLYNAGRVVSYGLFLPFMIWGGVLAINRTRTESRQSEGSRASFDWASFSVSPLAMLLLFMLTYSGLHILTWAMSRYRLAVDAASLTLAALAIDQKVIPWVAKGRELLL